MVCLCGVRMESVNSIGPVQVAGVASANRPQVVDFTVVVLESMVPRLPFHGDAVWRMDEAMPVDAQERLDALRVESASHAFVSSEPMDKRRRLSSERQTNSFGYELADLQAWYPFIAESVDRSAGDGSVSVRIRYADSAWVMVGAGEGEYSLTFVTHEADKVRNVRFGLELGPSGTVLIMQEVDDPAEHRYVWRMAFLRSQDGGFVSACGTADSNMDGPVGIGVCTVIPSEHRSDETVATLQLRMEVVERAIRGRTLPIAPGAVLGMSRSSGLDRFRE